jgi:formylglycine-generating enzyme required for sulfatase activity
VTGNYWDFPMGSSAVPNNGNPGGDTGNSANFFDSEHTIGSPYWRTPGGYFSLSDSPYGTFDQGGNVWEWNESVVYEDSSWSYRGTRGGSFGIFGYTLFAANRGSYFFSRPTDEYRDLGFRVSEVPEPGTMALLGLGIVGLFRRRRSV